MKFMENCHYSVRVWRVVVWCGVLCFGVVWRKVVWWGMKWCDVVRCGVAWCGAVVSRLHT